MIPYLVGRFKLVFGVGWKTREKLQTKHGEAEKPNQSTNIWVHSKPYSMCAFGQQKTTTQTKPAMTNTKNELYRKLYLNLFRFSLRRVLCFCITTTITNSDHNYYRAPMLKNKKKAKHCRLTLVFFLLFLVVFYIYFGSSKFIAIEKRE